MTGGDISSSLYPKHTSPREKKNQQANLIIKLPHRRANKHSRHLQTGHLS